MARIGIDTGGTFTDFLYQDEQGELRLHKVLSTPHAPEQAILQGLRELGVDLHHLEIIHGSTVATNAVLEGNTVPTAYITNRGFADVLMIGRQARSDLYDLSPVPEEPLIPRNRCLEVDVRQTARGEHDVELTDPAIDQLLDELSELDVAAVAINLLFSFLDDADERRLEAGIHERFGDALFISRSSDVLAEYREYERGVTTVLNAGVGPLMQTYLECLRDGVGGAHLMVMQSSGGITSTTQAGRYPVNLLLSGPAGGLIGAEYAASHAQCDRILTFDMGGTSTDVSIIDGGIPHASDSKIAGYPVGVSTVDMHTIGAGGGSIARVDEGGLLLVGPGSAGAAPGPACYGLGGVRATVTDANVVLGRLMPDTFLGGSMTLDVAAAELAVRRIANAMGLGIEEAAQGIVDVVNDHMVRALRVMSVQRGKDPEDFVLVSFGGAGGLHVCALAEAMGMRRAMVPVNAGVLSAMGMLAAVPERERARTLNRPLSEIEDGDLRKLFDQLELQVKRELLEGEPVQASAPAVESGWSVDLRYLGQSSTLNIPHGEVGSMIEAFHQSHAEVFGHRMDVGVELVNIRVRCVRQVGEQLILPSWQNNDVAVAPGTERRIQSVSRMSLESGRELSGPLLITEATTTVWLAHGWRAKVDRVGNLQLTCLPTPMNQNEPDDL